MIIKGRARRALPFWFVAVIKKELKIFSRTVRYYEAGDGPAIILVHGAGATGRLWHRQMGPLSQGFRVIAPDLPGFGGTDLFPEVRRVRDFAMFIAQFMDALGLQRASLVGSSMGGWASCWFALDFPDRLDKLVLISPAGLYSGDNPPMSVPEVVEELRRYYLAAPQLQEGIMIKPGDELNRAVETISGLDAAGGFVPDLTGRLGDIKSKTLTIWGSDDRVIPAAYLRGFKEGINGSSAELLNGAGHLCFVERAEEVNALILGFLSA